MKPLSPNTLLQNRYLVVHLIGKGGMGEVYLAVDQRLGSAVALKRTFFSDDEQLMTAFEREARTLARLRHPALPKVSDHFNENDTQYLVMEHISGDDLSKRLETTKKPFPLSWVLFWADQLLDALAYLHSHEPPIVHRDIKPQNLKLTNENHVILLDFGLAKNSTGQTHFSTGGSIVGYTPHYAPMEQIRGTGTTAKSDIYSLAATLYHLLAAQPPPDALTRADYILNSLDDPVQPLGELNPEVPRAISDVILKAMSLSADQRYASAREMQKSLRDAYSQMQNQTQEKPAVSATPAIAEKEFAPAPEPDILQSQKKTEQFGIPAQMPTAEIGGISSSPLQSSQKTEILETPRESEIDFDMTLRDGALNPTEVPESGLKTEILPAGFSESGKEEKFEQTKNEFKADATLPLISFDKTTSGAAEPAQTVANAGNGTDATQAVANFNSIPTETRAVAQSPVYNSPYKSAEVGQNAVPNNFVAAPPAVKPAQKKSGGALAAILGGVGVTTVAAGIGLYAFGDKLGITGTKPTPTPVAQPTVVFTPTPAPTVEQTNTNAGISNQNAVANANVNTSNINAVATNPTVKPSPSATVANRPSTPEQTTVKTAPPTPRPTQVVTAPPIKTVPQRPVVTLPKTPPVKTPAKKSGRTDIEQ